MKKGPGSVKDKWNTRFSDIRNCSRAHEKKCLIPKWAINIGLNGTSFF